MLLDQFNIVLEVDAFNLTAAGQRSDEGLEIKT
jgi:hypothetical protein